MEQLRPRARSISQLQEALGQEFRVLRLLGEGSTAAVYQAHEVNLGRLVAIKVPHAESAHLEAACERFAREAKALARLEHPNVARAYHFFRLRDDTPCLVMSLIRGRTIEDRLATEGTLPREVALAILRDVASALGAAHACDIVHRDVRPGNILWDDKKEVALLIDFGLATVLTGGLGESMTRVSSSGVRIDVSRYAAPEMFQEEEETWAVDMYALGVTAYELLTGEGPFGARTFRELLTATREAEPTEIADRCPGIDRNVARAVRRCIDRIPNHRPTAFDFVRALEGRWHMTPAPGPKALIEKLVGGGTPRILGLGFVGSGFLIGGAATLDQQYPGFLPPWAFTIALATGTSITAAAAVLEWDARTTAMGAWSKKVTYLLGLIGAAWAVATVLIFRTMG